MRIDKKLFIQLSGSLFEDVQKSRIFSDSMTFVDSYPLENQCIILDEYNKLRNNPDFDLAAFVQKYFAIPHTDINKIQNIKTTDVKDYINRLWQLLYRQADIETPDEQSLISLPNPYIVPGGRFRCIFYWDSFFTSLGLIKSGLLPVVSDMLQNFCYLIDRFGYIPNGNRVYFMSRSQPPFFAALVDLYLQHNHDRSILEYLPFIEKEYEFWMNGENNRVVSVANSCVLNRYYDDDPHPREESYIEDIELAKDIPEEKRAKFYRDIRAAAESGWDFSSRWLTNLTNLNTIRTTDILPVDLNSILYFTESKLSQWYKELGNLDKSNFYGMQAENRKNAINTLFWSPTENFYFDYSLTEQKRTAWWSLASVYPLYFGIATPEQAKFVAQKIHNLFLHQGGVVTTLHTSKQQWDYPAGWAPLQWLTIKGLEKYGYTDLASIIRERWVKTCTSMFDKTGYLLEKYNVVDPEVVSNAGEYTNQIGFGWTNGVLLDLM